MLAFRGFTKKNFFSNVTDFGDPSKINAVTQKSQFVAVFATILQQLKHAPNANYCMHVLRHNRTVPGVPLSHCPTFFSRILERSRSVPTYEPLSLHRNNFQIARSPQTQRCPQQRSVYDTKCKYQFSRFDVVFPKKHNFLDLT